jgi:hypothetical protein
MCFNFMLPPLLARYRISSREIACLGHRRQQWRAGAWDHEEELVAVVGLRRT